MFDGIIKIAVLCIVVGSASIPLSFGINSNPFIVWIGNALGSLFSAAVVIFVGNRLTSEPFMERMRRHRISRKFAKAFDEGNDKKATIKTRNFVNKHGLRLFGLFCPIFPGVLLSTVAVYLLQLDKKMYMRWMFLGVFLVSGFYVFAFWFAFVR